MDIKRTFDFLADIQQDKARDNALNVFRNEKWDSFSSQEFKLNSDYVSSALIELGIKKGDKIASVSNNRPEWNFLDMGMSQIGAVHVPIYPTVGEEEYEHILGHSNARLLILNSQERYDVIKDVAGKAENIEKIYAFDEVKSVPGFNELIKLGKDNLEKNINAIDKRKSDVKEDDLCSIIYTSGTTGLSKGVMMSHKNFVSNVLYSQVAVPENSDTAISFLPLNHVFERMLNYLYMSVGAAIYYVESTETIVRDIQDIKPDIFATVPRVLERVYDSIYAKGMDLKGIKKQLFFWALDLALIYEPQKDQGFFYNLKMKIASKLIFSKWRAALGGKILAIVSGGAALQPRLVTVFTAAGIPILEGYGLTETAPVISVNRLDNIQPGTVGEILEVADVKIAPDNEILYRGPNLMPGYYNDPEKTASVIDKEGWFHTGDNGELNGKILKITGRKKELFKLSTGKYIAPQLIENKFKESSFIDQIMVVGDGEKFCASIICPSFEFLHNWASAQGIHYRDNLQLITNEKVIARYQREVDKLNKPLNKVMKIKKFALSCEEWTPENGELSPTLKLKRNVLTKKYTVKLDHLYGYSEKEGHIGDPTINN
ncbi:MAG: long-chain fatty acid--CoA ligase [Bacteroidota bacterium]|nr:long-chain fatty acid--CoA ligase [Bacteroidota bacterium]